MHHPPISLNNFANNITQKPIIIPHADPITARTPRSSP
jgi:hypothetical protein